MVHALVAYGVTSITVSEPSKLRATQAKASGATKIIDPSQENVPEVCRKLSDGFGMHAVFDCAGLQASFDTALESARGRGIIVNVAIFPTTELVWKNPNLLNRRQLTITGSNIYTRAEFQEVIDAIASGELSHVKR